MVERKRTQSVDNILLLGHSFGHSSLAGLCCMSKNETQNTRIELQSKLNLIIQVWFAVPFLKHSITMAFSGQQKVVLSILAYSFCSGTLVLLNKLTLHYVPFPSLVVAFQLSVCIALIYGANFMGKIDVDPIRWEFVKPYLLYITFFAVGIYCNMRSLSISNVETVIVFRALCPLLVTFLDAFFLGREWPSLRSWTGLSIIVVGAYGYATYDEKFRTQGYSAYFWPTLYMFVIAMEMVRAYLSCGCF